MDTNVPLYKLLNNMNYEELEELAQKKLENIYIQQYPTAAATLLLIWE